MNTKYPFFLGDEKTEVTVIQSKVSGVRYEYFKHPKKALAVWYKSKQVMVSPRYCKVSKAIEAIEKFISIYETQMELAYTGQSYDHELVTEFRNKLSQVFSNTVA